MAYTSIIHSVVFGKEPAFGTEASSFDYKFGYIQEFSFDFDNNVKKLATLDGTRRYSMNVDGLLAVKGSVKWIPTDGREFEFMLGGITAEDTNADGTEDKWTITLENLLPSATALVGDTANNKSIEILGIRFDGLTISAAKEEWLTCSADFVAREIKEISTVHNVTPPTEEPYMFYHGQLLVDGTPVANVENIEISLKNNLEKITAIAYDTSTGRLVQDIIPKMADIDVKYSVIFTDYSVFEDVLGGQTFSMNRADHQLVLEFKKSATDYIKITLDGVRFSTYSKNLTAEANVLSQDCNGVARNMTIEIQHL